jgi:hypothetical protein
MENIPNPIPPVEVTGTEHGELPVDDPPPSGRPEEQAPVKDPPKPEKEHERSRASGDDPHFPPDPPPGSDPEPAPRYPKGPVGKHEARPETLADNVKVTPLDEDKKLEEGIEINET